MNGGGLAPWCMSGAASRKKGRSYHAIHFMVMRERERSRIAGEGTHSIYCTCTLGGEPSRVASEKVRPPSPVARVIIFTSRHERKSTYQRIIGACAQHDSRATGVQNFRTHGKAPGDVSKRAVGPSIFTNIARDNRNVCSITAGPRWSSAQWY